MNDNLTTDDGVCNKLSNKRQTLKLALAGSAILAWQKPIIQSVVLPAHAQTSFAADSITVSSLDADNPFARYILIVDSSDSVLANCGASGGVATATGLEAGTYRIFADSNGVREQIIDIAAGSSSRRLTVQTATGDCDFLVATIELPSGLITPEPGNQQPGSWSCSSNLNQNCAASKQKRTY